MGGALLSRVEGNARPDLSPDRFDASSRTKLIPAPAEVLGRFDRRRAAPLNLLPGRRIIDDMTLTPSIRVALAAVVTFAGLAGAQDTRVTPERLRFVLTALAHDSMEGRAMGSRGSMRAAAFIAEQFKQIGLTPAGDSGYFQRVPMFIRSVDPNSTLSADGSTLKLGVDFSIAPGRANPQSLDGVQVVYGGVRGEDPSLTPEQVRGKLVIFRAPPPSQASAAPPAVPARNTAPSCRDTVAYGAYLSGQRGAGTWRRPRRLPWRRRKSCRCGRRRDDRRRHTLSAQRVDRDTSVVGVHDRWRTRRGGGRSVGERQHHDTRRRSVAWRSAFAGNERHDRQDGSQHARLH